MEDDQTGGESSHSVSPWSPRGELLSDSEKSDVLADNMETPFLSVTVPLVPAVIEMVDVALESYPAIEPKLTNPDKVQESIRDLTFGKAPGPNGIPNKTLKHVPIRAVSLVHIFSAVLRTHYFPPVWEHAQVISILKLGKDPAQPTSYQPISLLDTNGTLFEKILLTRILLKIGECVLLREEQFGFRPRHSTSLKSACLVEITRNFGKKRLTGMVFLYEAKAINAI
jgi:hypothetical protein